MRKIKKFLKDNQSLISNAGLFEKKEAQSSTWQRQVTVNTRAPVSVHHKRGSVMRMYQVYMHTDLSDCWQNARMEITRTYNKFPLLVAHISLN
jgi:hypothetical protein